ncbi:hypothetical protein [Bosea sp. (in: a-proteobacteria)]|uniref:hypothetical protein n=1 Tax=Bosea sp. (in: a-proteobacteria) TaxID=1871050 RepID=UPI0027331A2E|nr:hypothetical protein [Bosea sp. (in: a-proteobacteria)]MDP3258496.1 hypothetical protein [Bosea sp. (in: a-proteobacteria)]
MIKGCLNCEDEESLWTACQFERDLAARIMGQAKGVSAFAVDIRCQVLARCSDSR